MGRFVWWLLCFILLLIVLGAGFWWSFSARLWGDPQQALRAGEELLRADRVLVFVAHPDDAEWWIGGTLRRLVLSGAQVRLVVASDGEKGQNRIGAKDLREVRRAEQRAAGEVLGYSDIVFWGLPDRDVAGHPQVLQLVTQEMLAYHPDLIITFDPRLPDLPYLHRDHEGLGHRVYEAWNALSAKPKLVFFHTRRPNVAVDITETIEDKIKAFLKHRSQTTGRGDRRNREAHRKAGSMVGVPYAELFREVVG